ncbi:hypothetical protein ACOSP7_023922 [Xanthoceras sorbifolium]
MCIARVPVETVRLRSQQAPESSLHALWSYSIMCRLREECDLLLGVQFPPFLDDQMQFPPRVFVTLCALWWHLWSSRNSFVDSGEVCLGLILMQD